MAKLNMEKAIKRGHAIMDWRYSMSVKNFYDLAAKDTFSSIDDAFAFGYYQGMKKAKALKKAWGGSKA